MVTRVLARRLDSGCPFYSSPEKSPTDEQMENLPAKVAVVGWVKHTWRRSGKAMVAQTVLCTVTADIANGNTVVEVFVFSEAARSPVPTNLCDLKKKLTIHPLAGPFCNKQGMVKQSRTKWIPGHEKISLN